MAELTLVYKDLEDVAEELNNVASKVDEYKVELSKKLTNKLNFVPSSPLSGGNTRTNQANYYVGKKKEQLEAKRLKYKDLSSAFSTLKTNAENADTRVAKSVNDSREAFLDAHENLEGDGWAAFFANLVVNVPVIGWIADKIDSAVQGAKDLVTSLKYWYEVCGGKKIIETALAIAGLVLAAIGTIVAFCTFGWTIGAIAGLVGAVIGLANAWFNLKNQLKANKEEDPAWASYYGNIDTAADHLRKNIFKNKWLNKHSGAIATGLEWTELICSVINIGSGIKKAFKRSGIHKLFETKGEFDFSRFKNVLTSKEGWSNIGKALKHNWKGMLFGDSGGVQGWQKRWKRAFTSQDTTVLKRIGKVGKVISGDLGKLNNLGKSISTVFKGISDGFDFKSIYSIGKDTYSSSGKSGFISTGTKTYDTAEKIIKKVFA